MCPNSLQIRVSTSYSTYTPVNKREDSGEFISYPEQERSSDLKHNRRKIGSLVPVEYSTPLLYGNYLCAEDLYSLRL
jgi:hypothetical protein